MIGCGSEPGGSPADPEDLGAPAPATDDVDRGPQPEPEPTPQAPSADSDADGASGDGASPGGDGAGALDRPRGDELAPGAPPDDSSQPSEQPAAPTAPSTIFIAGDSTVQTYRDTPSPSDQAGWGQMIGAHVAALARVDNRAIGGRTARRFIDEGRLTEIVEELAAGDYLFVQFGTNDGHRTATYEIDGETIRYFLDPATDFKAYLTRYVEVARELGATPVLVTPPPRNSAYCTGGNGTGAHAQAMRELGLALDVTVLDLNALTVEYLRAICPAPVPEDFFLLRADGSVDGTHFQENGARILARLVAEAAHEAGLAPFVVP